MKLLFDYRYRTFIFRPRSGGTPGPSSCWPTPWPCPRRVITHSCTPGLTRTSGKSSNKCCPVFGPTVQLWPQWR